MKKNAAIAISTISAVDIGTGIERIASMGDLRLLFAAYGLEVS
jgi:hypothetical protein